MKMIITRFNYKKYKAELLDIFIKAFLSISKYYDADMLGNIITDLKEGKDVKEHYCYTFKYELKRIYDIQNIKVYNKYYIFNKLRSEFVNKIYEMK